MTSKLKTIISTALITLFTIVLIIAVSNYIVLGVVI